MRDRSPLRHWKKVALAAAGVAWLHQARSRNRALRPAPVRDALGRPLTTRSVRLDDGERVDVIDAGRGPALLWIPGADGIKETWTEQLPVFARRYRVIAPDLRTSVGLQETFDVFARDMDRILETLGARSATVVGQSLGGAVAMHLAYRFPERVDGLVLCNTLARVSYEHVGLNRTALVPLSMATVRYLPTPLARWAARLWCATRVWIFDDGPGREDLVHYALFTGPRATPPEVSAARVQTLHRTDLTPELASIDAPTLVVKGPLDSYCPARWSLDVAARIRGASYATVPGTGHCSHVSRPDVFNRVVGSWLERHAPPEPGAAPGAPEGAAETPAPGERRASADRPPEGEDGRRGIAGGRPAGRTRTRGDG